MSYRIFYNNLGKIDAINREADGASIPSTEWSSLGLNLSDRPPTPIIQPPDFSAFARAIEKSGVWKTKIRRTLQKEAFTELVSKINLIAIAGPSPDRMQSLVELWNEVVSSLAVGIAIAPADITFLNDAATNNRVPIVFASNGTASVKS